MFQEVTFQPQKINKITPMKISYISGNKIPKKIICISRNGTFLNFRKRKPLKASYISGSNFPSLKNEKIFLSFRKQNLLPSLKKSYISGRNFKVPSLCNLFIFTFLISFKNKFIYLIFFIRVFPLEWSE